MRCLGRTAQLSRCKNNCRFLTCKRHKTQLIVFLIISLPSILLSYYEIYKHVRAEEVSEIIKVNELLIEQKKQDSILQNTLSEIQLPNSYSIKKIDSSSYSQYQSVISAYEYENETKLREAILNAFDENSLTYSEELGYVVAAYFGMRDYRNAAKIVLERDKLLSDYNHELKLDLIYCIRNASLRHGYKESEHIADSLRNIYGNKLLSKVWAHMPLSIAILIEDGIFSNYLLSLHISDTDKIQIKDQIQNEDPYCSYGYFLIGDYENALKCNPNTRIKDILLYASGYKKVVDLYQKYHSDGFDFDIFTFTVPDKNLSQEDIKSLNEAIKSFKEYTNNPKYIELPHYDDSLFWISWCYTQLGKYKIALDNLKRINDGDYEHIKDNFEPVLISEMQGELLKEDLDYVLGNVFKASSYSWDTRNFRRLISKMDNNSILKILNTYPKDAQSGVNYFIQNKIIDGEFSSKTFDLCLKISQMEITLDSSLTKTIDLGQKFQEFKSTNNLKEFLSLQEDLTYQVTPLALSIEIENAIERFSNSSRLDYLYYLLIRKLVIANHEKVESVTNIFLEKFPDSQYADDIIAETIYTFFKMQNNPSKGLEWFNLLLLEYNNTNAVDNVIYHIADYYNSECCCEYYERRDMAYNCNTASKYAKIITSKYPESSYYDLCNEIQMKSQKMMTTHGYDQIE
ncbi:hypothetical protein [Psychroserpens algicola]|uniref:Tetratricopeptide repeat protein n=1 Tax=Psychroserpens algicola TaxID=1719034 RepID=A0ABT0H3S6_9FLAO|nr:hypothetical protein [Psychroserpens algicola]MCK8479031.1 hypothetical protein [Psychroserpens algicola]